MKVVKICSCSRMFTQEELDLLEGVPFPALPGKQMQMMYNCPSCNTSFTVSVPWPRHYIDTFTGMVEWQPVTFVMVEGELMMETHGSSSRRYYADELDCSQPEIARLVKAARKHFGC